MLEFTKLSRFERSRTDMNELVRDTLSLFRQSAGEQVQVEIELPEPPPMLYIDRILVSHALFNLINNAAQANLDQKPIRIRLFPQEHEKRHLPGWCLTVQDHGPGVPDRILEKIYTPFFTTRAEGTGLGLTVVQHVAIVHEGEISAANAADGGAIFALWLPDTRDSPE
jgi:signal transduction histidine kinase